MLENMTQHLARPNVMDVKLGRVLFDDSAPEDKKARMEKAARDTTSGETGMRLTGCQVRSDCCVEFNQH